MKWHRLARLRLRIAAIGWIGAIVALSAFLWDVLINADFIASKLPDAKPLPAEMWLFFSSLAWLFVVTFWPELDKAEQPDVGLVWDWSEDQLEGRTFLGLSDFSKSIGVHNRSETWIYNIQIHPVRLAQTMTFDIINEIAPHKQHLALARWDGHKSSKTTDYIYFFGDTKNEEAASTKKYVFKKVHPEGLSDLFLKIPMRVTYEANNRMWEATFIFIHDVGADSLFEKLSRRRV